jgi:hypothetical protein
MEAAGSAGQHLVHLLHYVPGSPHASIRDSRVLSAQVPHALLCGVQAAELVLQSLPHVQLLAHEDQLVHRMALLQLLDQPGSAPFFVAP